MRFKFLTLFVLFVYLSSMELTAQEVTFFTGFWGYQYYQDDKKINKKEFESLLLKNAEANSHWKKSKTYNTLTGLALASEVGFAIWEFSDLDDDSNNTATLVGVTGSFVALVVFANLTNEEKKKAVLDYNAGLEKQTTFKLRPLKKGLGLALQF